MRPRLVPISCVLLLAAHFVGCQNATTPPPSPEPVAPPAEPAPPPIEGRAGIFEAARAWQHLEVLTEAAPRGVGSEGSERARRYLRAELEALGLDVQTQSTGLGLGADPARAESAGAVVLHNVLATLPGPRPGGALVLAARYDSSSLESGDSGSACAGADEASGAALLLELARVLSAEPLQMETRFVFLDGESPFRLAAPAKGPAPDEVLEGRGEGTAALAARIAAEPDDVHLVVFFDRVAGADLRIARDLMSHRIYREEFWKAARRLDRTTAFEPDAEFESNTMTHHESLSRAGVRRIVTIAGARFDERSPDSENEADTLESCSAASLETVGVVALRAFESISDWLARIDRISEPPPIHIPTVPVEPRSGAQ